MQGERHHPEPTGRSPTRHRILRLVPEEGTDVAHEHVFGVDEVEPGGERRRWGLVEFIQAVRLGERFYLGSASGAVELEPTICPRCARVTIAPVDA